MSNTLTAQKREIPVLLDCDVLIVGAGVRVVLAEANHFPGGVCTSRLMCSISNYFVTRDGTQVTTGLPMEFIDRLVSENGAMKEYLRSTRPSDTKRSGGEEGDD